AQHRIGRDQRAAQDVDVFEGDHARKSPLSPFRGRGQGEGVSPQPTPLGKGTRAASNLSSIASNSLGISAPSSGFSPVARGRGGFLFEPPVDQQQPRAVDQ